MYLSHDVPPTLVDVWFIGCVACFLEKSDPPNKPEKPPTHGDAGCWRTKGIWPGWWARPSPDAQEAVQRQINRGADSGMVSL
jgi:hypothetical protein